MAGVPLHSEISTTLQSTEAQSLPGSLSKNLQRTAKRILTTYDSACAGRELNDPVSWLRLILGALVMLGLSSYGLIVTFLLSCFLWLKSSVSSVQKSRTTRTSPSSTIKIS